MNNYSEIAIKIRDYISKLTADRDLIDEIAQEVFLKVHHSINTLRDHEKLDAWLKRIVYTTLMDMHREKRKVQSLIFLPDEGTEAENEGNIALMHCIVSLLKTLPDDERKLLEAVEVNGISQAEYARQHELPLSTVKSKVQRARKKIKDLVQKNCQLTNDAYGNVLDFMIPEKNQN